MIIRVKFKNKYYFKWKPKYNIYNNTDDITNDLLTKIYSEYIIKLNNFIKKLDNIMKSINKKYLKSNYRQIGVCER